MEREKNEDTPLVSVIIPAKNFALQIFQLAKNLWAEKK